MAGQQEVFTLYKKAEIEGYLEKISSGTPKFLGGKTRIWCELFGTVLYMFKDSKRTSTGAQQLDMKQVHMVRRSTSDKLGVQFEILSKDKQYTFNATSAGECDKWVQMLQAAMTLEDPENIAAQSRKVMVGLGDYEDIEVSKPCIRIGASSMPGYCEVELQTPATLSAAFQMGVASSTASDLETDVGEGGYSTVEVRRKSSAETPVAALTQSQSKKETEQSQPPAGRPCVTEDSTGYVMVELRKKSFTEIPLNFMQETAKDKEHEEHPYIKVRKPPKDIKSPEGSSDDDEQLITSAQSQRDPIPPFPYPLQPVDWQPLEALQEFLSSNRQFFHPSFADRAATENPVEDLKRALEELPL